MAMRLAGGVLLGRLVAPSTLGLFAGIGLVLGYASIAQLGILNGLNRELPFYMGKGDIERAHSLASAAQAWALAVGAVVFAGLTGVAIWQLAHGELLTGRRLVHQRDPGDVHLLRHWLPADDLSQLARLRQAGPGRTWPRGPPGLVGLALVALLGFYGLCLRVVLAGATSTALLFRWRPVRVGPRWDWADLRHLFMIGAPIFAVGQVYGLWTGVINSTLVLSFTGHPGHGALRHGTGGHLRLGGRPGRGGAGALPAHGPGVRGRAQHRHLVRIAIKPMLATCAGLSVVAVVGWFAAEPLVRLRDPAVRGRGSGHAVGTSASLGEQLPAAGLGLQRRPAPGHVPGRPGPRDRRLRGAFCS